MRVIKNPTTRQHRQRRRVYGGTLIEALIAGILSLLVGSAILVLFQATYTSKRNIMGQSIAIADSRRALDILTTNLTNAQWNTTNGKAISAASANDITIYTATTGSNTMRYWLDTTVNPPVLKSFDGTTTKTLLLDVQSLTFTYYTVSGTNFTAGTGSWNTTSSPNAPTTAELPTLGAIEIKVVINSDGYTRTLSTFVRFRNSPGTATRI